MAGSSYVCLCAVCQYTKLLGIKSLALHTACTYTAMSNFGNGMCQEHDSMLGRKRSRDADISESQYLLLELGTQEPVLQHCLKTLTGICLSQVRVPGMVGAHPCPTPSLARQPHSVLLRSQGVKLSRKGAHDQDSDTKKWSSQATKEFQKHIDCYWIPFCEEAIRMFFVLGFVPWHLRRIQSTGDLVPEIIPLGTFDWCATVTPLRAAQLLV